MARNMPLPTFHSSVFLVGCLFRVPLKQISTLTWGVHIIPGQVFPVFLDSSLQLDSNNQRESESLFPI